MTNHVSDSYSTTDGLTDGARRYANEHLELYLRSGGTEGHIRSLSLVGGFDLSPHLLLKHVGRKTGKIHLTPLTYGIIGGEAVVVASNGGADHHPAWYLNLEAAPRAEVSFQIATQAFRATWRAAQGQEREKVWNFLEALVPTYAVYRQKTTRQIPLVMLLPTGPADVFKA